MRTAIFTVKETKLTIVTTEQLYLEQMGLADPLKTLKPGVNNVEVGAGVFKVRSRKGVRVTADAQDLTVEVTPNDKDGGPIELSNLPMGVDRSAVIDFLTDAKGQTPP